METSAGPNCFLCGQLIIASSSAKLKKSKRRFQQPNPTSTSSTITDKDCTEFLLLGLKRKLNGDQDKENQSDLNINAAQILSQFQQRSPTLAYCCLCSTKLVELKGLISDLEKIEELIEIERGKIVLTLHDVFLMNQKTKTKKGKFGRDHQGQEKDDDLQLFRKQLLQLRTHSTDLAHTSTKSKRTSQTELRKSSRRSRGFRGSKGDVINDLPTVKLVRLKEPTVVSDRKETRSLSSKCRNDLPPSPSLIMDHYDTDGNNNDDFGQVDDHDAFAQDSENSDQELVEPDIKIEPGINSDNDSSPRPRLKEKQDQDQVASSSSPGSNEPTNLRSVKLKRMALQLKSKSGQISIFYCGHSSCSAEFHSQHELSSHVQELHLSDVAEFDVSSKYKEYICPIDGTNYTTKGAKADLLRHNIRHHGYKPPKTWNCPTPDCSLTFPNQMLLNYHIKKEHEAPMVCPHCSRSFTHRGNYNKHVNRHSGFKDHLCELCIRAFSTADALRNHCRLVHAESFTELPKYVCTLCNNQEFASKAGLAAHNTIKHQPDKAKFNCEICGHPSVNAAARDSHSLKHSSLRSIYCEFCDATFKRAHHYKEHVLLKHTAIDKDNPRVYACGICGKGFLLQKHLRIHRNSMHDEERKRKREEKRVEARKKVRLEQKKKVGKDVEEGKEIDIPDLNSVVNDADGGVGLIGVQEEEVIEVQESASQQIALTFSA